MVSLPERPSLSWPLQTSAANPQFFLESSTPFEFMVYSWEFRNPRSATRSTINDGVSPRFPHSPGPIEIGVLIEALGNGILISQMFSYFQKHGKDAKLFQFMSHYNQRTSIPPHLLLVVGVLRAYQLHKLGSRKPWLSVFSWMLSAYSTAMGISYFVVLRSENLLGNFDLGTNLPNSPIWMIYSACSVVILNQLIISVGTYRRLVMGRDRGLKGATRNVINFLAAISITSWICLIVAVRTWVGYFISDHRIPIRGVTPHVVHPILLMRLLNGRAKLRKRYFANGARVSPSSLVFSHNPGPRVSSVLVISRETILPENNPVGRPSADQDLP
ncbi:hypothetical protein BD779DRAFT_1532358 [Infundibulicybe gibba]|nr:hypothetical protein BD779DRAFT_1532358 [Infundibulicybe gibba]